MLLVPPLKFACQEAQLTCKTEPMLHCATMDALPYHCAKRHVFTEKLPAVQG